MSFIFAGIVSLLILVADRITKYFVSTNMKLNDTVSVDFLDWFIDFHYIENDGGAWGMMGGKTWILLVVTSAIMVVLAIFMIKNARKSKLFFWASAMIIAGGLGNMIDRIFRDGLVVDFLRFTFIDFPVFNVADCAVCFGAGLLILYFVIDIIRDYQQKALEKKTATESVEATAEQPAEKSEEKAAE